METTNKFFANVAQRINSENDLSDFTWAMCNTSDVFKKIFINFFFKDIEFDDGIEIKREFSHESGRPDFQFLNKGEHYIIENKKFDRNLHSSYGCFGDEKVAIIAIYPINKSECSFITKTWEELLDCIQKYIDDSHFELEFTQIVRGYIQYVSQVCSILKKEKMLLSNLNSLCQFNKRIENIVQVSFEQFTIAKNKGVFNESQSGYNFSVIHNESGRKLQGWYGVLYKENTIFSIEIKNDSYKDSGNYLFFNSLENIKNTLQKDLSLNFDVDYTNGTSFWVSLSDDLHEEILLDKTTIERQIEILDGFFKDVVRTLYINI